jgi:hypothetical protein
VDEKPYLCAKPDNKRENPPPDLPKFLKGMAKRV